MEGDFEECRQAGMVSEPDLLSEAANNILGRCKRVLHVARQHRDKNEDAVYRNGLQIFINQVENGESKMYIVVFSPIGNILCCYY